MLKEKSETGRIFFYDQHITKASFENIICYITNCTSNIIFPISNKTNGILCDKC